MLPPPQALSDADALDQLLQLQLRLVDQKLALAKQTRALQPAAALQQPAGPWPPPSLPTRPASWPSTPPSALDNDQPWRQQLAAQQQRLDALARRNGELARQCAEAQQPAAEALRRPRPEPKGGRPGDVSHTEAMLQESLQMQKELLARLNREAEENEVRRMEAADEDAQASAAHTPARPHAPQRL